MVLSTVSGEQARHTAGVVLTCVFDRSHSVLILFSFNCTRFHASYTPDRNSPV